MDRVVLIAGHRRHRGTEGRRQFADRIDVARTDRHRGMVHDSHRRVIKRQTRSWVGVRRSTRLKNALSVCRYPNSTSTGVVMKETAGFLASVGCRLAPVIEASEKRTATPFGGVSRIA